VIGLPGSLWMLASKLENKSTQTHEKKNTAQEQHGF
jgi:hypothetical protein